jgi:hypothetical protein
MDRINAKFGKGALSVGALDRTASGAPTRAPNDRAPERLRCGARISFQRVPDLEEF